MSGLKGGKHLTEAEAEAEAEGGRADIAVGFVLGHRCLWYCSLMREESLRQVYSQCKNEECYECYLGSLVHVADCLFGLLFSLGMKDTPQLTS